MGGGEGGRDPRRGVVGVLAFVLAALVVMATDGSLRKGSTDKGAGPGPSWSLPAARRRPGGGPRTAAEHPGPPAANPVIDTTGPGRLLRFDSTLVNTGPGPSRSTPSR